MDSRKETAKTHRVLIVEDNAINRLVASVHLEKAGLEVDVVADGFAALEALAREQRYDLVLMDCQMPGLDGYETCRRLRRLPGGQLPVIAVTANALRGDREKCLAAGMDDYLAKPYQLGQLLEIVGRWIPLATRREETAAPPAAASATLETSHVESLRQVDALERVVALFLEESPPMLAEMREALAEGDFRTLREGVHALKGSSGYLGASELLRLCRELQGPAREKDSGGCLRALGDVEAEYGRLEAALRELVGSEPR